MKIFIRILKWAGIVIGSLLVFALVATFILNLVFGYQLRQTLSTLKAEGRALTVDDIRPPPVPDDQNAFLVLKKACEMLGPFMLKQPVPPIAPAIKELTSLITSNSYTLDVTVWPAADREKLPGLIQAPETQQLYALLAEAAKKPGYNCGLKYEDGPSIFFPNLGSIRAMVRLLVIKATLAAQAGDVNGACDTVLEGFKLAELLKQEPVLVTQLLRLSCDLLMIDCLERISDSAGIPADKARAMIAELSCHTDPAPMIRCMDGERVTGGVWCYDWLRRKGSYREIADFMASDPIISCIRIFKPWIFKYGVAPWLGPWFKKDFTVYLKLLSQIQDYYKVPYYQVAVIIRDHPTDTRIPKYCILTRLLLPDLDKVVARNAAHDAAVDVARVGLGLKLYKQKNGAYPDTLDKLAPEFLEKIPVDPFTGKALIYRKAGEGFVLYSVGPDLKDDNGTPRPTGPKTTGQEPYDIVWKSGK